MKWRSGLGFDDGALYLRLIMYPGKVIMAVFSCILLYNGYICAILINLEW